MSAPKLIGETLLFSALIRFSLKAQGLLAYILTKHYPTYHLVMGIIHGLTNLGGAFLAILASSTSTEKVSIRYTIAHYYLAFSAVQMLMMGTLMGHLDMLLANFPVAVTSVVMHVFVGDKIFSTTSNQFYSVTLTIFIALYGVVILLNL